MSQNFSSAAVMIGALRINPCHAEQGSIPIFLTGWLRSGSRHFICMIKFFLHLYSHLNTAFFFTLGYYICIHTWILHLYTHLDSAFVFTLGYCICNTLRFCITALEITLGYCICTHTWNLHLYTHLDTAWILHLNCIHTWILHLYSHLETVLEFILGRERSGSVVERVLDSSSLCCVLEQEH